MINEKTLYIPWKINYSSIGYVNNHKITYIDRGEQSNVNTVFCVHDLIGNAHDFDFLSSELSKFFRVISLNLPGRGTSSWLKYQSTYNYYTYMNDIIYLLDHLNIKKIHWIGTALGGVMGMILAAKYPDRIKSLILNDVGPEIPIKSIQKFAHYVGLDPSFDDFDSILQYIKLIRANSGIEKKQDWVYIAKNNCKVENGVYKLIYDPQISYNVKKHAKDNKNIALWNIWNKISCDVLLIRSNKSDMISPSTLLQMRENKYFDSYILYNVSSTPYLINQEEIDYIKGWLLNHR